MITVGSVAREIATARFLFLAEHYPGRRSAIRDLTHRDPEFVFWIYPDGRLHDARRSHRDNVPKGCQHILADEPYFLFLTVVLASIPFPFPFWAGLLVGLLVGGGAFLRERYRWVRDTPQCIEVTAVGLTVTEKLSVPQSVEWAAVRKVASDDELGGWRIEMADRVL